MDSKKSLIALALVALIGIIGGTYAYFTSSATLNNTFKTGTYATSVTEEFTSPSNWTPGTTTTKKINVQNNGSVAIVARAKFVEGWKASNGTPLSLYFGGESSTDKIADFTIGTGWVLGADGWYYYNTVLTNGNASNDFISAVTFDPNFELRETTYTADGQVDVLGDITCTKTGVEGTGTTTVDCKNEASGYAGATYTLDVTIETVQADQAANLWTQAGTGVIPTYTPAA